MSIVIPGTWNFTHATPRRIYRLCLRINERFHYRLHLAMNLQSKYCRIEWLTCTWYGYSRLKIGNHIINYTLTKQRKACSGYIDLLQNSVLRLWEVLVEPF